MANEIRVRGNLTSGTLSASLTNVATSMSSAGLANLPVVGATQHAVLTIENELVYVTAHTSGATTATILRGQEGTAAAAHNSGVAWVHGPVASDYDSVLGYAQVTANQSGIGAGPTDLTGLTVTVSVPYAGHRVKITGHGQMSFSDATTGHFVDVLLDGATVGRAWLGATFPTSTTTFGMMDGAVIVVPTAASHTFKLTAGRFVGSGTLTLSAGASNPAYILVEDLGPAA